MRTWVKGPPASVCFSPSGQRENRSECGVTREPVSLQTSEKMQKREWMLSWASCVCAGRCNYSLSRFTAVALGCGEFPSSGDDPCVIVQSWLHDTQGITLSIGYWPRRAPGQSFWHRAWDNWGVERNVSRESKVSHASRPPAWAL